MSKKPDISKHLSEVPETAVSHSSGIKKVLLRQGDSAGCLTQIAYGSLNPLEQVEFHTHPTMEEYFFFLGGEGVYYVGPEEVKVSRDVFVCIPANTSHSLKCSGNDKLEFFYFGVAIS
jgi:mannose-6-phosphate isomerase-like protein (cupin superfamily)